LLKKKHWFFFTVWV